jgi:hypothetical protein
LVNSISLVNYIWTLVLDEQVASLLFGEEEAKVEEEVVLPFAE